MKLNELLKKHGFKFSKKYGQNFLSDGDLLGEIVNKGGVNQNSTVLEIGCGAGTLTKQLCSVAKYVHGYEIDKTLAPVLGENLAGIKNCEITFRDIMRERTEDIEKHIGTPYMIVANLPYYITSPLIMKFIEESNLCESIVIMVQEEVADRVLATEGSAEYGAITAGINLVANSERLIDVPREMFLPVPNVDSSVIKITFDRNKFNPLCKKTYRDVVRTAFSSRRKTLANNLKEWLKCDRQTVEQLLQKAQIDLMARGETLSAQKFVDLSDVIYEYKKGKN